MSNHNGFSPSPDETRDPADERLTSITPLAEWEVECLSRLFSALGDPGRLRILRALSLADELRVSDLADHVELSVSAVSHQLRLLRDRDLVNARRKGRTVFYSISDDHVRLLLETGLQHACQDCRNRPRDVPW
jgi:DNA-binding transcriptional ArsR family regulator